MAYDTTILAEGALQSYWHLSEPSGSAADSKGAITGTFGGGVGRATTGLIASYSNASCQTFTADGGGVTFGDNYDFNGTAAFSAEIWVDVQSFADAGDKYLMAKWDEATGSGWKIMLSSTGNTFHRGDSAGAVDSVDWSALTATNIYHIVATYDGSTMNVYQNGTAVTAGTASSRSIPNHTVALAIGAYGAGGSACNALLDEFAIYNAALSSSAVASHYSAAFASAPTTSVNIVSPLRW